MKKEETKNKKKKTALYIVGSLALAAGAVVVAPIVIDYLSDKMYKPDPVSPDDDDWGPEIVKREKQEENTPSAEGDSDGEL